MRRPCKNNALHVAKNVDISYSIPKLYNELNVDRVDVMAKKAACKIVYQAINRKCPNSINDMFKLCDGDRTLRSHNSLIVNIPRTNTRFGDRNFVICGGKFWNSISDNIKSSDSVESFKAGIKTYSGFG